MDKYKIGKAIAYLRRRAGYTQKDLANRLNVSDKAVSKWERGLGLPDISYLGKLSILLDTDTDSLLSGDVIFHDKRWFGILVLPQVKSKVCASETVYDKPMIYYLLSYYLLIGIKEIYIVSDQKDEQAIVSILGDGKILEINLHYLGSDYTKCVRTIVETSKNRNAMIVYGRILIYGVDQTRFFQKAMRQQDKIIVMSLPKKKSQDYTAEATNDQIETSFRFNAHMKLVSLDSADAIYTQYEHSPIPVIFCPGNAIEKLSVESDKGKYEIDIAACVKQIYTEVLDRGYVEMPLNNALELHKASTFVNLVQEACGMEIYCIEEIAWRRGMIDLEQLKKLGQKSQNTLYGQYILDIWKRNKGRE